MPLYIDIHALHTVPPSNINRDDTGAPKTATFGGVVRQRVSSQAWKRAIRKDFEQYLQPEQLGWRTKRIVEKAVKEIKEIAPDWQSQRAVDGVVNVLQAAGIKPTTPKKKDEDGEEPLPEATYLLFLSAQQIRRMAEHVVENDGAKPSKKGAAALLDQNHSVDIAMFGRMVADAPDYNVDAAVQVAHALGVAPAEPEFDYYTAVDDAVEDAEETGAGMIGTVQMMSSTLYRYATVNLAQLEENLASKEASTEAVAAFVQSFITSMPTGKQNSYANRTMPEAVIVSIRDDRPISLVNAFEEHVEGTTSRSRRQEAAARLAAEAKSVTETYSAPAVRTWVLALPDLREALHDLGDSVTKDELIGQLTSLLREEA